jgi:hypothetical protein
VPLLEARYAGSPYVAYLQGDEPYGYRELEDSLQSFALGLAAAGPPAARGPGVGPPGDRRRGVGRDSIPTRPGAAPRPRRGLEP